MDNLELAVIGYGLLSFGVGMLVMTFRRNSVERKLDQLSRDLVTDTRISAIFMKTFVSLIKTEGKKTRKDIQEAKTRLTQVRKDLNQIGKKVGVKAKKAH